MSENIKTRIIVDLDTDLKTGISVVSLLFPKSQPLTVKESASILTSAVSMLIKSCDNSDMGIKSHDLIKEVVDHLHSEYVNTKSFEDSKANPIMKVGSK
jgi:hypothetical protein